MHHGEEAREAPPVPPPPTHAAGDPLQAELSIRPGLGWCSSEEQRYQPPTLQLSILLSFPAPQAGVCRLQGWWWGGGRSGKERQRDRMVGGRDLGEVQKQPLSLHPFTWGAHCRAQSPGPFCRASRPQPRT